jgi:hypothetical protein
VLVHVLLLLLLMTLSGAVCGKAGQHTTAFDAAAASFARH